MERLTADVVLFASQVITEAGEEWRARAEGSESEVIALSMRCGQLERAMQHLRATAGAYAPGLVRQIDQCETGEFTPREAEGGMRGSGGRGGRGEGQQGRGQQGGGGRMWRSVGPCKKPSL